MTDVRSPSRILRFCRDFVRHDPRSVTLDAATTLVMGAFQGVGVMMLVPLLAYIGVPDGAGRGSVSRIARVFFHGLHLPRSLPVILGAYVVVVAVTAAVSRYQSILDFDLQTSFVRRMRTDLQSAILRAEWRFLVASRKSDFLQVLANDVLRAGQAASFLLRFFTSSVTFLAYLCVALVLSFRATVVALLGIGILTWLLRKRVAEAGATSRLFTGRFNEIYAALTQQLDGLVEVRAYGAEARSLQRFHHTLTDTDALRLKFIRSYSTSRFWMTTGGAATLAALLFLAMAGLHVPLASLMLLVYVFARILPQATQLQSTGIQLLGALPGHGSVSALLHDARAAAEPTEERESPSLLHDVTFDGVSFSHRPDEPTVSELCFTIPAQRTTALVGPSGAGKSTTALLLLGILTPERGRILVDGVELTADLRRGWRRRIGYVPQDAYLLHDTVRANLLWARPDADEEMLWGALRMAAAEPFVRALPEGLDTVVGDRGVRLSGGERQRVALARALLVSPEILLLDEATSSLDLENERRIFDALADLHGRMTIVVITHRIASLGGVDDVIVLEGGTVTEHGARAELASRTDSRFSALRRQWATGVAR